ncbi:cell wall-binding repeat-containing protein [Clostridium ljungdahlii]|uniref:N-acetylmuramoyl-L-alanine amidase LytC n=2 Tax=Clostridium ljungdahlii TaxID=1538 RepID=D8GN21_CLOLD|nr:cell wall-binding repeat-containing protein [Clostridium ljungdahlii]ADK13645.1 predicted cell wall binding protein [Clostridium ljungdahlii DSM 13528]OAA84530.1 N-acetylmuramoyl-L-alanine amidase LytC precursor [Clostridium ljungdahlii DSM 13528]
MKKIFKLALGQAIILGLAFPGTVSAASSHNVSRIYGSSRYQTSINICNNFSSGKVQNVIVTSGNNFPDALAGSVLSKQLNAPILLVDKSLSDSQDSINYIKDHLDASGTVYVLGGYASVSDEYINYIKSLGFNNIKRLGGKNRFDTNKVIVENMNVGKGTPLVIVNGSNFPDALSISSIAGMKGYPIILSNTDTLPDEVKEKISEISPSSVYIIGGQGALSDNIISEIKKLDTTIEDGNIIRIWGKNRYETSLNICKYFNLDSSTVVIANGENFPDALSGSALAAKLQAPILLTDGKNISTQKEYIDTTKYTDEIILGGSGAVSEDAENELKGIEKKLFEVTNEYVGEDGKYYIEGNYLKYVTDINEALDYVKRTGDSSVVEEDNGQWFILDDGFDMTISDKVKLEVDSDVSIKLIHFDSDGNISYNQPNFTDMVNGKYEDRPVFNLFIKDGKVMKMDQQFRP